MCIPRILTQDILLTLNLSNHPFFSRSFQKPSDWVPCYDLCCTPVYSHLASRVTHLKGKPNHVTPVVSHLTWCKYPNPSMWLTMPSLLWRSALSLTPSPLTLVTLIQPRWPPWWSSSTPDTIPLYRLYSCCPFPHPPDRYLIVKEVPDWLTSLPRSFIHCSNLTFLPGVILSTLFSIAKGLPHFTHPP